MPNAARSVMLAAATLGASSALPFGFAREHAPVWLGQKRPQSVWPKQRPWWLLTKYADSPAARQRALDVAIGAEAMRRNASRPATPNRADRRRETRAARLLARRQKRGTRATPKSA